MFVDMRTRWGEKTLLIGVATTAALGSRGQLGGGGLLPRLRRGVGVQALRLPASGRDSE
jgi:hypothetical protein